MHRRHGVVFVGNLNNPTNLHGLRWFLRDVWPAVRAAATNAPSQVLAAPFVRSVRGLSRAAVEAASAPLLEAARQEGEAAATRRLESQAAEAARAGAGALGCSRTGAQLSTAGRLRGGVRRRPHALH